MASGTIPFSLDSLNIRKAPSNKSLDEIIVGGLWWVDNANGNSGYPEGTNGILLVLPYYTGTSTWCKQIYMRFGTPGSNDGNVYIRETNNNGTSWGAWWLHTGTKVT